MKLERIVYLLKLLSDKNLYDVARSKIQSINIYFIDNEYHLTLNFINNIELNIIFNEINSILTENNVSYYVNDAPEILTYLELILDYYDSLKESLVENLIDKIEYYLPN